MKTKNNLYYINPNTGEGYFYQDVHVNEFSPGNVLTVHDKDGNVKQKMILIENKEDGSRKWNEIV